MKILFICTHNACRSILSEAITRQLADGRIQTASAGTSPAAEVHPLTLRYLHEHGYDSANLRSKPLDSLCGFEPDVVITVCDSAAGESCPLWLGAAIKIHWGLPDPSHQQGTEDQICASFAAVIAAIERRTQRLLEQPFEAMKANQIADLLTDIGRRY
ncbi:MAG: arsenate reductase ArsC [Halioglobus sp.]